MPSRSFRRGAEGTIVVSLPAAEIRVLRALGEEMAALLGDVPPEVADRLYPPAYDDPAAAAEFRRLMAGDLEERKRADLATLQATLGRDPPLVLSGDEARSWLGAVQDMRLALGQMLGITDESWESEWEEDDHQMAVLHYLGYVQDSLVRLMM